MEISPFLLERHFAKHEFEVPFQLSCSDCEPLALSDLLAMASPESTRLWENLRFTYTESPGHPVLRQEIARFCGIEDVNDIIVCVPEEGIFLVMNSLLNSEDHVIVIAPAYQSLYQLAVSAGCSVDRWYSDPEGTFHPETLFDLVTDKTRMVVINFPHNPTGSMITTGDLERIATFCYNRGITLFSDEMYRGLESNPANRLPCASVLNDACISLSGMSKAFSLPGLRIGWLVCQKPEIRNKLIRLKDYTTICSSAPSEILSIMALRSSDRILKHNLEIIRSNCQTVTELIRRNPEQISWREPAAGSVGILSIKSIGPIEQLCDELLDRQGILTIGSHFFSLPDPGIRLGLGRLDFKDVVGRFANHIGLV